MRKKSSFVFVLLEGLVFFVATNSIVWAGTAPLCTVTARGKSVPERVSSREPREVRVFLKTQHFGFYERGKLSFWGPVCTGARGFETPRGKFRVLMKAQRYFSRRHGGVPMPYSVQFSVGGHFLHVGEVRPKPSSRGCVRLREEDAARIFRTVKIGDSVTVIP
ncbi:MAG: L,D-transpeptidase [Candidatus Moranbacteria bacterium]|nr:L,D-transpeptidase [Candidatus Moranbacteria bacterium]